MTAKRRRYIILLVVIVAALLIAVVLASNIRLEPRERQPADRSDVQITELALGLPRQGVEQQGARSVVLRQKREYVTSDSLALKVVSKAASNDSFPLSVRLVNEEGAIQSLTPSDISVQPGDSGYCCWVIEEPGEYTWQVFRPDGGITSLPINIRLDRSQGIPDLL